MKNKQKKQLFHCPSLSEMLGGLLPKRHIHSFRQSTNFFAPLAQHRLTVLHKFMHFQGRGGRKINIISQCIHTSQRQQRLHRAGLNSAADPGLAQPWALGAAADWLICVSASPDGEEKKCTLQQQRTLCCLKIMSASAVLIEIRLIAHKRLCGGQKKRFQCNSLDCERRNDCVVEV